MLTLGGFGMGLLYDLCRLTWYVELASLGPEARTLYRFYADNKRRQSKCIVDHSAIVKNSHPTALPYHRARGLHGTPVSLISPDLYLRPVFHEERRPVFLWQFAATYRSLGRTAGARGT